MRRRILDQCDERAVRTILAQDSRAGLPSRLGALALASPLTCYGMRNTVTTSDIPSAFLTRSFLFFFSLVSSSLGNPLLSEHLRFIAVPCRDNNTDELSLYFIYLLCIIRLFILHSYSFLERRSLLTRIFLSISFSYEII